MKSYQPPFFPGIETRRRANLPEPRALNRLIARNSFCALSQMKQIVRRTIERTNSINE